jgi:PTS system nitrogen regulatory IIA component
MYEYQITFFVEHANHSGCIASGLSHLVRKFKSKIHIINLTRNRCADLSKSIGLFRAGLLPGDLCQITAIGIDAELACFVLRDVIDTHYIRVGSRRLNSQSTSHSPTVLSPYQSGCPILWHASKINAAITQFDGINTLAQLIYPQHPDPLTLALVKREEISSTCIAPGIALPHVMFDAIDQMAIAVLISEQAINWHSIMGNVHLIIGLVLPARPTRDQLTAATYLTRNLLAEPIGERLLLTRSQTDLRAILSYLTTRLLPAHIG